MREVKPVAYMYRDFDDKYDDCGPLLQFNEPSPTWDIIEELYTKEQLHPHVKMTQAEFDEFKKLSESGVDTIYDAFDLVYTDRGETDEFENIYNRLFGGDDFIKTQKNQLEFSNLWAYYNPEEPEEMIEIVPSMKWFVRSKETSGKNHIWLDEDNNKLFPRYIVSKEIPRDAKRFDTKEEAEEWCNPLTEAILLPVEG